MQIVTGLSEAIRGMIVEAYLFYGFEIAVLVGGALAARSSMVARERSGRRLVAWEPTVCGVGGSVLSGVGTVLLAVHFLALPPRSLDALSWYVFLAAGQGAFIGLWVALYRTVGVVPSAPPRASQRGLKYHDP